MNEQRARVEHLGTASRAFTLDRGQADLDELTSGAIGVTVAEAAARGPLQVAVVGPDPGRTALAAHARAIAPGGSVVVAGAPDTPGVPLLAHRPLVDSAAAAYVCRGFVCDRPVTTPEELTAALGLRA